MGFNDAGAERIVLDIETVASPDAADYIEPAEAPANYKDPIKIAEYIASKRVKQIEDAGLEADLCEVVAVGWMHEGDLAAVVNTRALLSEADLLRDVWYHIGNSSVIGFRSLSFDLPVLIRRSQYLGVTYPDLNLDKYRTPHVDLAERLSFNGKLTWRSLGFYCRRFGIPSTDQTSGADIAQMVAQGDWAGVASHCRADVEKTAALARRLGWLPAAVEQAEAVGF